VARFGYERPRDAVWPRRYVEHYGPLHRAYRRLKREQVRGRLTPGARYEPCPFHHLRRRRGDHLIRMGVR
jgi:hypothetical protein